MKGDISPEIMPQIHEIIEVSILLMNDKCQFSSTEPESFITLSSNYLQNTKLSSPNSSLDKNQRTALFMTHFKDKTLKTFGKTIYHT